MKKIFSLLLIISLGIAKVNAQTPEVQDLVAKGVKLHDSGDFNGAIELYKQALAIDEKSPLVNYELSSSYFALKNYEKAIEYADHVIDYGKDYVKDAYILKGSAQDLAGKADDAVQTYKKAIKKFPDSYLLHYNLALTSYNTRDNKTAEESLQKALQIRPSHSSSHLLLSYVMHDQGSRVKSLLALYNFLLLEPNGPRTQAAYKFLQEQLKQGVSKGKDNNTINITLSPGKSSDEFSAAELMISLLESSKSIEKNKDKSENELFTENIESFFSVLGELKDKKKGFWWNFYVDFFYSMKNSNHVQAFSYLISQSKNDATVDTWLKDNQTKVEAFNKWFEAYDRKI